MDINGCVFIDGCRKYLIIIEWQKIMKSQLRKWNEINNNKKKPKTKPIWVSHWPTLFMNFIREKLAP